MKLGEIFVTIVSEASGNTPESAQNATDMALKLAGSRGNFDKEIPDAEAQELLTKLRRELPGVREWLGLGGQKTNAPTRATAAAPSPKLVPRSTPALRLPRLNKGFTA